MEDRWSYSGVPFSGHPAAGTSHEIMAYNALHVSTNIVQILELMCIFKKTMQKFPL